MTVRRRRRPGSDRLYVTSPQGLPLGHLDLPSRIAHDVPTHYAETFRTEVDGWLTDHGRAPLDVPVIPGPPSQLTAGAPTPVGGWTPPTDDEPTTDTWSGGRPGDDRAWDGDPWTAPEGERGRSDARTDSVPVVTDEDLAGHLPAHGLAAEAAAARARGETEADREHRLRIDGRHAVADALGKLAGRGPGLRRPRWRLLHGIMMVSDEGPVLLDHLLVGPAGIFVIEVAHHPGRQVVVGPTSLEIDRESIDLDRRRLIAEEVEDRIDEGLAAAAGAERTLNPPQVRPVIAVVGAVIVGRERPPGLLVARVGQLPRLLQAFGTPLTDVAVQQIHGVARRTETWA